MGSAPQSLSAWRELKEIILFAFRDDESVTLCPRLDIKEGEVLLIFPHTVARDLSRHDLTEDTRHIYALSLRGAQERQNASREGHPTTERGLRSSRTERCGGRCQPA
jgi:hypothetical protein